ncbi:TIGR04222 domain-containing membrane protein [Streptomyces sp. NPDC101118]|uniref:TIGR04222 domain-containing membrane protein n=1 Tax=Streptomyces sp. NPDC101118 TaxID=3366109 RepID=UPI0038037110
MFWVLFLLLAWAGALGSCTRLVRAATEAAGPGDGSPAGPDRTGPHDDGPGEVPLSLYEAAYLAGGPQRVALLALLALHGRGRLLLARTGWATVVDPVGRDEVERSVLGAFGPDGRSAVAAVRTAAAGAPPVRALGERLGRAGLAVPEAARLGVAEAVRQVQGATLLVLALGAAAVLMPAPGADQVLVVWWFALPLVLTVSCLGIARFEAHPYTPWASPAGQRLLAGLDREREREDERGYLTAVAVRGLSAVRDPDLRAALSGGRGAGAAHRGH